ncbi:hypothetical protein Nepgr_010592 [Nepenthes gracilis]|uniref:Uncharacterized protein n=1 Tax=Nepenthes gracilis TaxID=150966 RepID=A0AAD3SCZ0_NEPGR|nr:hypothetical protein Nepgr_010592 [Nepenthes gracilis]
MIPFENKSIVQSPHARQFARENPRSVALPHVNVKCGEEVTKEMITASLRRLNFYSTVWAHDRIPGDYGGPIFRMPGLHCNYSAVLVSTSLITLDASVKPMSILVSKEMASSAFFALTTLCLALFPLEPPGSLLFEWVMGCAKLHSMRHLL